ncbi:MAG: mycofactocin precursor [Actinobacteria bacterium]|nr:mycofactocin precursor [Actinomycetota bacterium]
MTPSESESRPEDLSADDGPEIIDEIEVEDLAVDGICGVY